MRNFLTLMLLCIIPNVLIAQTWINVGQTGMNKLYDYQEYHGRLYACGVLPTNVRYYDATGWHFLPYFINGASVALSMELFNDQLYVCGDVMSGDPAVSELNDSTTSNVGSFSSSIGWAGCKTLKSHDSLLYCGGHFDYVGAIAASNIAVWNGLTWDSVGRGLNNDVYYLADFNGDLIAGGSFTASGSDSTVRYVAKWDGAMWAPFDSTVSFSSPVGPFYKSDTAFYIANVWDTINGIPMKGIAKYDGESYFAMGDDFISNVRSITSFNDTLYIAEDDYVKRWNGAGWDLVGSEFNSDVFTLEGYNGELYCGGQFSSNNGTPTYTSAKMVLNTSITTPEVAFVTITPNPASTLIVVSHSERGKLTIVDNLSRVVYTGEMFENATVVDVTSLAEGFYSVTVSNNRSKMTGRFVVSR
jgi:hypothetical protein